MRQTISRRGQRRGSRDGQVRVLATWSYGASARNDRTGSASSPRQILVKVPCVSTSNGGGGGATKSKRRGGGVPYRLAWNHEVRKGSGATGVCSSAVDSSEENSVVQGDAGSFRPNDKAPGVETAAVAVAAVEAKRHGRPNAAGAGIMVQLPRPAEGDRVSSTTPGDNSGFGCALFSASDSEPKQQQQQQQHRLVVEENRPSTSRVIANLRASVACDVRPSSASAYSSSFFSTAPVLTELAGSGALPVSNPGQMQWGVSIPGRTALSPDVRPYDDHEDGLVRPNEQSRPQSAAASSVASRLSLASGGAGGEGRRHGATATSAKKVTTSVNLFEHDAVCGKAVAATRRQPLDRKRGGTANRVGNQQQNSSRRPKPAAGTSSAERRGRAMRAPTGYSFFPSSPPAVENVAGRDLPFDGGHAQPFSPGEPMKGGVSEWEGPSSFYSDAADEARGMAGYALDSPGTWREAVGY